MTLHALWRLLRLLRRCNRDSAGKPRAVRRDRHALEDRCKEALGLMEEARNAGFHFAAEQGRLTIYVPPGGDPSLRARLLDAIAPVMPLFLMRIRLLGLASTIGVPRQLVMR